MKDILRKTILFGLGLGAITRDKAESLVKDLRKKGYFDEKEGKKLVNDIISESLRTQKKINDYVRSHVKEAMDSAPFATKQDLKNLEKRLSKKKKR
jgi:polyhydroxyalkanoate synthesis regulator phasin